MISLATGFQNPPIDPEALPTVEPESFVPIANAHLTQQRAIWGTIGFLTAAVAAASMLALGASEWILFAGLLAISILVAIAWVVEQIAFKHRGWLLREHDISARQGLIGRHETTAPFSRIQHIVVTRGALDRLFGLARLQIFTAGASHADLVIIGLTPERAESLREATLRASDIAARNQRATDKGRNAKPLRETEAASTRHTDQDATGNIEHDATRNTDQDATRNIEHDLTGNTEEDIRAEDLPPGTS